MKKKIFSTLLAGAAVVTMGIASANASTLDAVSGDIKFLFDGFDSAQTTYSTALTGVLCSTIATCDAASGAANAPGASIVNDVFGFADISAIKNIGSPINAWNAGDDGDLLLAYFFGFNDVKVDVLSSTSTNIFSVGGDVIIYLVDLTFRTTIFDTTDQASMIASLAGETKYLELIFDPGCDASVAVATLCGNFDLGRLQGSSNGFAHAVGGTALSKYPFSFQFEQSVEPCDSSCDGTSFNLLLRSGSALTTALPEPGALGLLGLGLVGLGLIGRRRKAA